MIKETILGMIETSPLDPESLLHAGIFACEMTDYLIHSKANCPDDIQCGPECPDCCEKTIPTITIPEAIYINQYVKENGVEPKEYEKGKCPWLNEAGSCAVHPARPVRCRGWNSRDLEFCKNTPKLFDVKNCAVWFPQFQASRQVHTALIGALESCGYTGTLIMIDEAFRDNFGIEATMLTEGLSLALAEMT